MKEPNTTKKMKKIIIRRFGNYINTVFECLVDKWISDNVAVNTGEVELDSDGRYHPAYSDTSKYSPEDRLAAAKRAGYTFEEMRA